MPDLAERLRADLHDAVDGLSPGPRLDDVVRRRVRRRVLQRRVAGAGAVLAAVAVVTAGVTVAPRRGEGPPAVVAGQGTDPGGGVTAGAGPPPGVVRVEGSFAGTETYAFTDGGCPDLDHVLDATFELSDGTLWQYHTDYCGDLDGEMWSGNGTFTLTTPDGSTLTGTRETGPVELSRGAPDPLTITGGTGRYDGASGSCVLEQHLTQVQIGVQEHDGTFTCDIRP